MDTYRHHEKHLKSSAWLNDVAIGMSDGLIIPFALAAGLSGAVDSTNIIVIAGIAVIAAGSIAMGLGGYFSIKTENDHYKNEKEEHHEADRHGDREIAETKEFFAKLGLSEELQEQAIQEVSKDKNKWAEFITKYEAGPDKIDPKRARKSALNIGLSYVIGGFVPISPYFFITSPIEALKFSASITLVCLFIVGWFRSKITGAPAFSEAIRVTLIGAGAAAAAFGVAKIFEVA